MVDVRTNLLKNRQTLSEKDYQRERNFLRWSVFGLVVVVVLVVALSAWNLVLTNQVSKIDQETTAASKQMQGLVTASAQQVYLKSRLKLVTNFLAGRSLTREALQKILSTTIPNAHVAGLDFKSEAVIGVSYIANDANSLSGLLDYYQADTAYFTQVVSQGITRNKDGTYQMSLGLTLPKETK